MKTYPSFIADNLLDELTTSDSKTKFFVKLGTVSSQTQMQGGRMFNKSREEPFDMRASGRDIINRESIYSKENVKSTENLFIRENFPIHKESLLLKKQQPTR